MRGAHLLPGLGWLMILQSILTLGLWLSVRRLHTPTEAKFFPLTAQSAVTPADGLMGEWGPPAAAVYYDQPPPTNEMVQAHLYCARVLVETPRLADDLLLKVFVLMFNGSPFTLKLSGLTGAIRWAVPPQNDRALAALAKPMVTLGGDDNPGIAPFSDSFLQIYQYVPAKAATAMLASLDNGGWVLDFREFNAEFEALGHSHLRLQAPIWDVVTVRRSDPNILYVGRIISMVGIASVGTSASLGT